MPEPAPPTVAELIAFLLTQPADAKVVLEDPDTSWSLVPTLCPVDEDNMVMIRASYGDRL